MKNLFILSFLVCGIAHAQCPVVYEVNATNFTLPSPHEQTTIEINDGYFVGDYNLSYYTQTCGTYRLNDPFAHASWLVYRYSLNGASTHTNYTSIDLDADQLPNLIVEFDVGPDDADTSDDQITRIVLNPNGGNLDILQACKALEGTLLCLTPTLTENSLTFQFPTETGKAYQPQFTTTLDGVWQNEGESISGDGSEKSFTRSLTQPHGFYRLETN
jgi:hypothetical protein